MPSYEPRVRKSRALFSKFSPRVDVGHLPSRTTRLARRLLLLRVHPRSCLSNR